MKKLLLSLAMLLTGVGAWGQTATLEASTTVSSPEHQYLMMNCDKHAMGKTTSPVNDQTRPGRFAFFADNSKTASYFIYSIDQSQWLSYDPAAIDNTKGFVTLVDAQTDAKAWKIISNTDQTNTTCYQFSPYDSNGDAAEKYMNWYQGGIGGTANPYEGTDNAVTIGLYGNNAHSDNGSAWVLTEFPVDGEYALQDIASGRYVNIHAPYGKEANAQNYNQMATLSNTPKALYITPSTTDPWQWSIHTEENGGMYLNQYTDRVWDSKVSDDEAAQAFLWDVELYKTDDKTFSFILYTGTRYVGADMSHNVEDYLYPLYLDPKSQNKYIKLQLKSATPSPVWQLSAKLTNNRVSAGTQVVLRGAGGRPGWAYKGSKTTTTTTDTESGETTETTTYNMYLCDNTTTSSEFTDEFIFTMISTGSDGSFKLKAYDGTFFNGGDSFTDDEANAKVFTLKAKPNADAGIWNIAYDNTYLNMNSNTAATSPVASTFITTGWSQEGDTNGKWEVYTVNNPELQELTLRLSDTENSSNTYDITYIGVPGESMPPSINNNSGVNISLNDSWNSSTQLGGTITFPFAASNATKDNMMMISSFSQNAFKWYADGTSVKATKDANATSEDVMKYLWAIYPSFADGALNFTIKNMATGTYINSTSTSNSHDEGTVTLSDDATKFTVESDNQFKLPTGKYLSLNSTNTDATQLIGTWDAHNGTKKAFPTPIYNVNIGSIEAATLYTPFAVTIPAETKAKYIMADGNSDALSTKVLKYTTLENTIPANTAVVILGTTGNRTFTKATEEPATIEGNLLFGYSAATTAAETEYSSKVGTSGTIFALHGTKTPATFGHFTGTTFRAGKAYLDVSSLGTGADQVRSFILVDDNLETGIEDIRESNEESSNGAAYDLSGRRVNPTAKGMYIINGKKVIK